ncbi:MAG: hypothetical protein KF821_06600 [Anaerolineales bacterium]|nr:hypothetical protein [Anaerolineales bacterium]MCW5887280.1 hypothetical protein [Anaerolineales bacterium]
MDLRKVFIGLGKGVFYWGFVQIILIGAAYFGAIPSKLHAYSGYLMTLMLAAMLILALLGKLGGRVIGLTVLALVMLAAQGYIRSDSLPAIAKALHPIFGIGVMFLGQSLAKRAAQGS